EVQIAASDVLWDVGHRIARRIASARFAKAGTSVAGSAAGQKPLAGARLETEHPADPSRRRDRLVARGGLVEDQIVAEQAREASQRGREARRLVVAQPDVEAVHASERHALSVRQAARLRRSKPGTVAGQCTPPSSEPYLQPCLRTQVGPLRRARLRR